VEGALDRRVLIADSAILVITALLAIATLALTVIAWSDLFAADSVPTIVSAVSSLLYAGLGSLIVRRARNPIGWILQVFGMGTAAVAFTSTYAIVGIVTSPGSLPAAAVVGSLAEPIFVMTVSTLGLMLFLFPDGRLPSPRWRPVAIVGVAAAVAATFGFAVNPSPVGLPVPGGLSLVHPNTLGVERWGATISGALTVIVGVLSLSIAAAFLSLVSRYRRGTDEVRQQVKWIAFAGAMALTLQLCLSLALFVCRCDVGQSPIALVFGLGTAVVVLVGVPIALAVAILRYRLYEIDVIISRSLVYGSLAAMVSLVYVGVVVGIGTVVGGKTSPILTVVSAVAIALLFQPVRHRAQRLANRLVYGERSTPYQVLSDFAERMAGSYDVDDVLQRMASVLAEGTGAIRVDVWLRVGSVMRSAARWPVDTDPPETVAIDDGGPLAPLGGSTAHSAEVRHRGDLLGALTIEKPPNEPLTATEDHLVKDLASQAGLVLRNARLTAELETTIEELRASRRRLVGAQDDERRKIERNLHDGAQQRLVALGVQLGLLDRVAQDPVRVKSMVTQLQEGMHDALDELRDLARGIYPPLLADKGLAVALEAQARKASVPTTIEADGIGRYPQEVEAAVYFCVLEAMQNVAKYADATRVSLRFGERAGNLAFVLQDDGRGFDPSQTDYGTGVQGMADRLDALGGFMNIESEPGCGTTVSGEIPVRTPDPVTHEPIADGD
jgi:signal transduction histidine kinase